MEVIKVLLSGSYKASGQETVDGVVLPCGILLNHRQFNNDFGHYI